MQDIVMTHIYFMVMRSVYKSLLNFQMVLKVEE